MFPRMYIAKSHSEEALNVLEPLLGMSMKQHRTGIEIEIYIVQALAYHYSSLPP
jgi:hypothetical protein